MLNRCRDEGNCKAREYTSYGMTDSRKFLGCVFNHSSGREDGLGLWNENIVEENTTIEGQGAQHARWDSQLEHI